MANTEFRWPTAHGPAGADIHVANGGSSQAPPEFVWAWLIQPELWPRYYGNARRLRPIEGGWPVLESGSRFSWVTFGAPVKTVVTEFEPFERLAWTGEGLGARGHHAWLLRPDESGGCRILTEETQRGAAVRSLRPILRPAMRWQHQRWVDGLAAIAGQEGMPP